MKFRMHRGGFAESMMTACEIEPTMIGLAQMLRQQIMYDLREPVSIQVKEYDASPDMRNGWEKTCIVLLHGDPIAFTDGIPE